jgi:hypothetical protein
MTAKRQPQSNGSTNNCVFTQKQSTAKLEEIFYAACCNGELLAAGLRSLLQLEAIRESGPQFRHPE